MLFGHRQFFIRLGRLEVFVRSRQKDEPLVASMRSKSVFSRDVLLWLPGVHLVVSLLPSAAGWAAGEAPSKNN